VDEILDAWVTGVIGPRLREREFTLLLERNDEMLNALRPRALEAKSRWHVAAYSAAMSRRATLLALRPAKEMHVRVLAEDVPQRMTSTDRIEAALRQFQDQRSPAERAAELRRQLAELEPAIEHQPMEPAAGPPAKNGVGIG
jgi:hypothetical protein